MKSALKKSIALHLLAFLLIVVDLPLFWHNKIIMDQVPIVVDLKDVKISEITNLPPKAKFGDEDKEATRIKPKKEKPNYAQEKPEEIVLQNLRYQMEALYHSWAEIKTLDGSMAYHIREIVRGHKYWIECLDTAVSLYGVVNEIHRITIRIEGEGENFF